MRNLIFAIVLGSGSILIALFIGLGKGVNMVNAQGGDGYKIYYVAVGGDCRGMIPCYASVQAAVDATDHPGDIVKVASGTYDDVSIRQGTKQVVFINKTLELRGGYTTTNTFADPPNPKVNLTKLDAKGNGRVVFISGLYISPVVEGFTIVNGNASRAGDTDYAKVGGGVYSLWASSTISNNVITGNVANSDCLTCIGMGGGIAIQVNSTGIGIIENNIIANNTASVPGSENGLGGGVAIAPGRTLFRNNVVKDNTALVFGGGIYIGGADNSLIEHNIIEGNIVPSVMGNGGGIHLWASSDVKISKNIVINNKVASPGPDLAQGGGICVKASSGTIENSIVARNQAFSGGGIFLSGSSTKLINTTIADNYGDGGTGVHIESYIDIDSDVTLTNIILVKHQVGITVASGNTVTLKNTLWGSNSWANGTDWGGEGTLNHINDYYGNPDFVAPNMNNYRIGPKSEAIDKGVQTVVMSDIDDEPRSQIPDLGADEYWTYRFLPILQKR